MIKYLLRSNKLCLFQQISVAILGILILLGLVTPAFAATNPLQRLQTYVTNQENQASKSADRQATRQADQLSNVIKRADTLIQNRLTSLSNLKTRINGDSRLSADEKSSLSANVDTDVSGLTTLKTKIDADTDVTVARTDAKSIITDYHIYLIFMPKIRLVLIIDNLSTLTTNFQALTPKIQDLINNLKGQGKDVTTLQSQLDDINSRLQTITTTLNSDKQTLMALTASSTNAATTFSKVRSDLVTTRQSFAQIRQDITKMRAAFGSVFSKTGASASPSATTTP